MNDQGPAVSIYEIIFLRYIYSDYIAVCNKGLQHCDKNHFCVALSCKEAITELNE